MNTVTIENSPCKIYDEDNAMIQSIRSGNLDSFNALVLKYQDQMFRVALRILGNEQTALDATQEALIAAYSKLGQFQGGSLKAWLLRIVVNKAYDEIRMHRSSRFLSLECLSTGWSKIIGAASLQMEEISPAAQAESHDLQSVIQKCLNRLPVQLRTALIMVDVENLSYVETSIVLGIPVGTVKSRLARARLKMQKLLTSSGEFTL